MVPNESGGPDDAPGGGRTLSREDFTPHGKTGPDQARKDEMARYLQKVGPVRTAGELIKVLGSADQTGPVPVVNTDPDRPLPAVQTKNNVPASQPDGPVPAVNINPNRPLPAFQTRNNVPDTHNSK